jgi:putative aldouronate transport system substrate-binding protein
MKKHLKLTVLIIVIAMIFGLVSACGGDSPEDTDSPKTETSNGTKPDTKDEEDISSQDEFTIANPPVTYKAMKGQHHLQPIDSNSSVFQEIARITGITIDIEGVPTDYDDKKKVMLSTDSIPDILAVVQSDAAQYGPKGAFVPISDYMDMMPNFKARMEESGEVHKMYSPDEKLYYFPSFKRYEIVEADIPVIRYDVVQELGKELPKDYDELKDVLMAIKEKYPDSYPWTARGSGDLFQYISYGLGSGAGIYYDKDVEGGKWLYGPAHDDYEIVFKYMTDLYDKGLIDPDYAVNNMQAMIEKITSEKSFFYWDGGGFTLNMNPILQEDNPDAFIAPLPHSLTNYKGQTRGQKNRLNYLHEGYAISSKAKNPEYIIKLFDWMYSDEGADITNFGAEGIDWERNSDGNPVPKANLVEQYKTASDPWRAYMGYLGAGQLGFSVYWDESNKLPFMSEQDITIEKAMSGNPDLDAFPFSPVFTTEEAQRIADIQTALDTLVAEYRDKILMGELQVSEFKTLQKKLIDNGAAELEEIYNNAEARSKK